MNGLEVKKCIKFWQKKKYDYNLVEEKNVPIFIGTVCNSFTK